MTISGFIAEIWLGNRLTSFRLPHMTSRFICVACRTQLDACWSNRDQKTLTSKRR